MSIRVAREIYDPPIVLYAKGRLLPEITTASRWWARRTTHYGQDTARKLAYQLAGTGITVVSGGTRYRLRLASGRLSANGRTSPCSAPASTLFIRRKTRSCTNASRRTAPCYPVPLQP